MTAEQIVNSYPLVEIQRVSRFFEISTSVKRSHVFTETVSSETVIVTVNVKHVKEEVQALSQVNVPV